MCNRLPVRTGLLLLLGNALTPGLAREIVVLPDPAGGPVLSAAVSSAADGDNLHIRKGLYRETVVLNKRLQLIGEEGVILDPSQPFQPQWQPAPDVGKGAYHNTIVDGKAGLVYSSFNKRGHQIGAPRWHYFNNLVVSERGFFVNWRVKAPVNFTADYNLVVGGGKPWPNDSTKDQHSIYVKAAPLSADYRPEPGCPAIDAGHDLSTAYRGKPLPGCEPGYFKGKAPDIGALEVK